MRQTLGLIAILACLCACQSTANKYVVNPDVEQIKRDIYLGMNGFTGEIVPFHEPIRIQYKECPQFHMVLEGFTATNGGRHHETSGSLYSIFGALTAKGSLLNWRFSFDKIKTTTGNGRHNSSTELPGTASLISFHVMTDSYGSVKSSAIDISRSLPYAKSPGAAEKMKRELATIWDELIASQFVLSLPREPIAMGDQFGKPDPKIMAARMGALPKEFSLQGFHTTNTVMGLTTFQGRKHLITKLEADANGRLEQASLSARLRGYQLINIENGLVGYSKLYTDIEVSQLNGGRQLYRVESGARLSLEDTSSAGAQ